MSPKSSFWKAFHSNGTLYKNDKSHYNAWCLACIEAFIIEEKNVDDSAFLDRSLDVPRSREELFTQALETVQPVSGKRERFLAHVKACGNLGREKREKLILNAKSELGLHAQETSASQRTFSPCSSSPSIPPNKRSRNSPPTTNDGLTEACWTPERQEQFNRDLCRLFVSNGFSWNAAANPETQLFVDKWVPGAHIPDRRILSDRLLKEEVERVEGKNRVRVTGRLATGQCDGWKNVSKVPIVTSMMTVANSVYLIKTDNLSGEPKTGDRLLALVLASIKHAETKFGVEIIAWCTDDGPDGKKMRRLLRARSNGRIITIVCWAHQINLVVGDLLDLKLDFLQSIEPALEVIKWFNNHNVALHYLHEEMNFTRGKKYALILPVITRWTAHFLALSRLLYLRSAVQTCCIRRRNQLIECAGKTADVKAKARAIIDTVNNEKFWDDIKRVKLLLQPLAIPANITQAPHTRLDHVLLTLGNLFEIYSSSTKIDNIVQTRLICSLENRWAKADQEVFILAVVLNPYIRGRVFRRAALTPAALWSIFERIYSRLFGSGMDNSLEAFEAFEDYRKGLGEFSDLEMSLEVLRQEFDKKGKDIDLVLVWSRLDDETKRGRNCIAQLAIRILSVIANSAGCERAFSEFGITHSKHRNRLGFQKVHDTEVVKMDCRKVHEELKLMQQRPKRKHDEPGAPSGSSSQRDLVVCSPGEVVGGEFDFARFAEELVEDARADSFEEAIPTLPPVTVHFRPVSLSSLFHFPSSSDDSEKEGYFNFYWKGGNDTLDKELTILEESSRVDSDPISLP